MSDAFEGEELQFPLECQYRIIAENREEIHFVIETVLLECGISAPLEKGHASDGGRYQSFFVTIMVQSRDHMNLIDSALRSIVGVKMVL